MITTTLDENTTKQVILLLKEKILATIQLRFHSLYVIDAAGYLVYSYKSKQFVPINYFKPSLISGRR